MEDTPHAAVQLTDATFDQEVTSFDGVVLVDFWAEWCGPCKVMEPRIEELAAKYKGNPGVKIAKINVDENEQVSMNQHVLSLPTFKIFHKGEVIDEVIGARPAEELEQLITRYAPAAA